MAPPSTQSLCRTGGSATAALLLCFRCTAKHACTGSSALIMCSCQVHSQLLPFPPVRVFGAARAVACFHGVVALGTASGVTFVLLPRGLGADGGPDARPKVE